MGKDAKDPDTKPDMKALASYIHPLRWIDYVMSRIPFYGHYIWLRNYVPPKVTPESDKVDTDAQDGDNGDDDNRPAKSDSQQSQKPDGDQTADDAEGLHGKLGSDEYKNDKPNDAGNTNFNTGPMKSNIVSMGFSGVTYLSLASFLLLGAAY